MLSGLTQSSCLYLTWGLKNTRLQTAFKHTFEHKSTFPFPPSPKIRKYFNMEKAEQREKSARIMSLLFFLYKASKIRIYSKMSGNTKIYELSSNDLIMN